MPLETALRLLAEAKRQFKRKCPCISSPHHGEDPVVSMFTMVIS